MERGGGSNCGALQGRGLIPGHRESSIQPRGSREDRSGVQPCKPEEGQRDTGERGRSAVPTAAWAPAPVRAVAASSAPSKEICCFQQASTIASSCQRRSGWVGEKWGRLAYATESWWADLESRHKLSAVQQAQITAVEVLCCSAVPVTARVSLRSWAAGHLQPAAPHSPGLPAGPVAQLPQTPQTSAVACPTVPGV